MSNRRVLMPDIDPRGVDRLVHQCVSIGNVDREHDDNIGSAEIRNNVRFTNLGNNGTAIQIHNIHLDGRRMNAEVTIGDGCSANQHVIKLHTDNQETPNNDPQILETTSSWLKLECHKSEYTVVTSANENRRIEEEDRLTLRKLDEIFVQSSFLQLLLKNYRVFEFEGSLGFAIRAVEKTGSSDFK